MKKRPLWRNVLVELDKVEKVSSGGIILPDTDPRKKMAQEIGTVVGLGRAVLADTGCEGDLKIGDKVLFKRYAGVEANCKGDEEGVSYRAMNEEEIILVIEED